MLSAEILEVLTDEVTAAGEEMDASLLRLAGGDEPAFEEAREDYLVQVQRIASAAELLNLAGLEQVCAFVADNLGAIEPGDLEEQRQAALMRWPQLLIGYLKAPTDGVYAREMAELFRGPEWPQPLEEATATALGQALLAIHEPENDDTGDTPDRQTEARPEDVALELAPDVNPQLVDVFLTEGPTQAGEYSALIQRVVRGEAGPRSSTRRAV